MSASPRSLLSLVLLVALCASFAAARADEAAASEIELFHVEAQSAERDGIVAGPDGNIWFVEGKSARVGRITPTGQITEFPVPVPGTPRRIVAGPDGRLWLTVYQEGKYSHDRLLAISPDGTFSEVYTTPEGGYLGDLAVGPDGALWLAVPRANEFRRVTVDGQMTAFPLPRPDYQADGIISAPGGRLWFLGRPLVSGKFRNVVGSLGSGGAISEAFLPVAQERARDLAAGPDGRVWATQYERDSIARVAPAGTIEVLAVVGESYGGGPERIVIDRQGDAWFTGYRDAIMRMSAKGEVSVFENPYDPPCGRYVCGRRLSPKELTIGPDGAVWFLAGGGPSGMAIGRIDPDSPPPIPEVEAAPSLHGPAVNGGRITARVGIWRNEPDEYAFRWRICDRRGLACKGRPGSESGIPLQRSDIGHTVRTLVIASNRHGSASFLTAPSKVVRGAPPPLHVAIDSFGEHVGRDGRVNVHIECAGGPPGAICSGRVFIRLRGQGTVGVSRYRLASRRTGFVPVRITRQARAQIDRRVGQAALVTVTVWDGRAARHRVRLGP